MAWALLMLLRCESVLRISVSMLVSGYCASRTRLWVERGLAVVPGDNWSAGDLGQGLGLARSLIPLIGAFWPLGVSAHLLVLLNILSYANSNPSPMLHLRLAIDSYH